MSLALAASSAFAGAPAGPSDVSTSTTHVENTTVQSIQDLNNDGVPDCLDIDLCPDDPDKTLPGACGCGVPDTDTDGDGIPDCYDTDAPGGQENPDDNNGDAGPFAFCGVGTAACLPLMAAGLGLMHHRFRRRRR